MDFNQLIRNWHTKASDEDYFSKFVFEYLAFIAFLKKRKFTDAVKDRDAIQKLKQDDETKKKYLQEVDSAPESKLAWENIQAELGNARLGNVSKNSNEVEEIKWWNCSLGSDRFVQQSHEEEIKKPKGMIYGLDDWGNMVEFWYSIRNNLFHGGKNPQDERDKLLVENGYKTLRPLIEIFLSNES